MRGTRDSIVRLWQQPLAWRTRATCDAVPAAVDGRGEALAEAVDAVAVLHDGRLLLEGAPVDVLRDPRVVEPHPASPPPRVRSATVVLYNTTALYRPLRTMAPRQRDYSRPGRYLAYNAVKAGTLL